MDRPFSPWSSGGSSSLLGPEGAPSIPAPARALLSLGPVRNLPARIIAFGIWPRARKAQEPVE